MDVVPMANFHFALGVFVIVVDVVSNDSLYRITRGAGWIVFTLFDFPENNSDEGEGFVNLDCRLTIWVHIGL
jgi:hypothetical protein